MSIPTDATGDRPGPPEFLPDPSGTHDQRGVGNGSERNSSLRKASMMPCVGLQSRSRSACPALGRRTRGSGDARPWLEGIEPTRKAAAIEPIESPSSTERPDYSQEL
jgi:hypothetical protein